MRSFDTLTITKSWFVVFASAPARTRRVHAVPEVQAHAQGKPSACRKVTSSADRSIPNVDCDEVSL